MKKDLQVGIIGASADRGWAKAAHVPAVQGLAGLHLAAVVSGGQAKSDAAAKAFGARVGYADAKALFADAEIDIVSVCVKVPDHRELVLAALAAGKHIYCEWPLGRSLAESEELAAAAGAAGVHVAIGLQTRRNSVARKAREMIVAGAIGRLLSARIVSSTVAFGPKVEAAMIFAENAVNGATLVTIQGAHTLDLAIAVLGRLQDLNGLTTTQFPEVEVGEEASPQARSTPDHMLAQARLADGCALAVEVAGGRQPEAATFRLEVTGSAGELRLNGGAIRGFQSGRLKLSLNGRQVAVDEGEIVSMSDEAANVAALYAALRDDIATGTRTAPDFDHAVLLTRLMGDVMSSSRTGTRVSDGAWPWP